jgi:hypothetical protein
MTFLRRSFLLLTLLTAACVPSREERPRPTRPPPVAESRPAPQGSKETRQCLAELQLNAVKFRALPDRTFSGGCSAIGAVQLLDVGTPISNLGAMTCPAARQLARWVREAVQPAATQFLGSRIVKIESFGTYNCRPINNQAGNKLSEHGKANAVDIAAFTTESGRRITILTGWNGPDENVRLFLRAAHKAGCARFNIGLGPEANALHRDHFHFDMGRGPYCR